MGRKLTLFMGSWSVSQVSFQDMCQKTDLVRLSTLRCYSFILRSAQMTYLLLNHLNGKCQARPPCSNQKQNEIHSQAKNLYMQPIPQPNPSLQLEEDMNCLVKTYQLHFLCLCLDTTQYVFFGL